MTAPGRRRREVVRTPAEPRSPARVLVSSVSLAVCVLSAWSLLYVLFISDVQEARSQHELYATFRAELAQAIAPVNPPLALGAPVAMISIPKAGLHDSMTVEGTTSGLLRSGPGHLPSSVLPGEPGVSILFGRSATFGAPFGGIASLHSGDLINIVTGQGSFTYAVMDVRRKGDPLPAAPAANTGRLVLETADSGGWRSGWAPTGVVYVDAQLRGTPQPDPGGQPGNDSSEEAMHGESGPLLLMEIVLQLELLVASSVAVAWLWVRWSRWQLWLAATPLLLAVLWGLTTTATRLLPNLL
ncbi:MAG TPA: sortase [Jatrophihabitantaceae bacterium]|jgi:sortase A|nr:sortase [Jatrophihabitantaceae bacterium]